MPAMRRLRANVLRFRYIEWKDYFLENLERLIPKIYKPAHKAYPYGSTPPVSHPCSPPPTAVKLNPIKYALFSNETMSQLTAHVVIAGKQNHDL